MNELTNELKDTNIKKDLISIDLQKQKETIKTKVALVREYNMKLNEMEIENE
jgi:hypothetical protein